MEVSRRALTAGAAGAFALTMLPAIGRAEDDTLGDELLGRTDFWIALEAYTYGYPLVTME